MTPLQLFLLIFMAFGLGYVSNNLRLVWLRHLAERRAWDDWL